jgi:hypothetical protein
MAREILSKRNFFDFESPDSAITRFPMTFIYECFIIHTYRVVPIKPARRNPVIGDDE